MKTMKLTQLEEANQELFQASGAVSFYIGCKDTDGRAEAQERLQIAALAYARACGLK